MASCTGRNVQLEEDELPYRKGSSATVRSEGGGAQFYRRSIPSMYDSVENLFSRHSNTSMRIRRISSLSDGSIRFPKLEDCAHFHYDVVELGSLKVSLIPEDHENHHSNEDGENRRRMYYVKVQSSDKSWTVRRSYRNFCMLDRQLHRCIFDRKFSHLPNLCPQDEDSFSPEELMEELEEYLKRFSSLAGSMLNCGTVLNWLEIDNRGNRLLAVDDSGINTPAIAAAHAVKRYTAQAADEISLEVGDIVSVIDMPPTEDTIWWRGKRGFEVGFFPYECVEVIGDKVPPSVASRIPVTPQLRQGPLMKKHGKLLSFLRLFFSTRPARNQLKQSGIVKERVFGCDLGEHLLNSGHDVPLVLKSCSEVIETHGIVDGIYRLSGITSNIQKLRLAFDEDRVPDLTSEDYLQDIHSISSLLKMYFRELPNPLLTYQLYDKFADAVRDEDNKLLKIHDVVQQLPPPHYRTTEYLMKHLARVAESGHETGMHSKNLAIVWAPNLLRSKELETGGGAAALQGVGIQAVVTEFLILYADLIFSDKMPSYSSPELKKTQKKPRPKSLAISTPTRLLTLEEARERALMSSFGAPQQKYIDVGGGPSNLPSKYHTVIDVPGGYKKKVHKDAVAARNKKSPASGLKSLFSRSRTGSIKQKGQKPSIHESLNFEPGERKAITEEDVQSWKRRRIRSAKSAESLLSLPVSRPTSTHNSTPPSSTDPHMVVNIYSADDVSSPSRHKRSMSTDASRSLADSEQRSLSYPSFVLEDMDAREMPIDVDSSVTPDDIDLNFSDKENDKDGDNTNKQDNKARRKQSFVRGDSKRRVICHRRTPSAPSTPRMEPKDQTSLCSSVQDTDVLMLQIDSVGKRTASQPQLSTGLSKKPPKANRGKYEYKTRMKSDMLYFEMDGNESLEDSPRRRGGIEETVSEKRKGSKTPPKDRKKMREVADTSPLVGEGRKRLNSDSKISGKNRDFDSEEKEMGFVGSKEEILTIDLPESPGSRRKHWTGPPVSSSDETDSVESRKEKGEPVTYFFSRHHDYEEILSDDEGNVQKCANGHDVNFDLNSQRHPNGSFYLPTEESSPEISKDSSVQRYKVESINNLEILNRTESQQSSQSEHLSDSRLEQGSETAIDRIQSAKPSFDQNSVQNFGSVCSDDLVLETDFPAGNGPNIKQTENVSNKQYLATDFNQSEIASVNVFPSNGNSRGENEFRTKLELNGDAFVSPGANYDTGDSNVRQEEYYKPRDDLLSEISNLEQGLQSFQQSRSPLGGSMTKCVSIPSELQRSLDNIVESNSDLMSSVTISELSQSQDSFNNLGHEFGVGIRRRRSTSLDSLNEESPLSRTLREINAQIDKAFRKEEDKAKRLQKQTEFEEDQHIADISSQLISFDEELAGTPVAHRSFGSVREGDLRSPEYDNERPVEFIKSLDLDNHSSRASGKSSHEGHEFGNTDEVFETGSENKFVERPAEIQIVETPTVIRAPLRPQIGASSVESNLVTTKKVPENQSRPKPPNSLDISPSSPLNNLPNGSNKTQNVSNILRRTDEKPLAAEKKESATNIPFSLSEEDFQKELMSDPDSLRSMEQTAIYGQTKGHRNRNSMAGSPSSDTSLSPRSLHLRRRQQEGEGLFSPSSQSSDTHGCTLSGMTSPLSPEHKQPRWEDLAGLNDDFENLAGFNDNWKKQLAPTGDSIRQSHNAMQKDKDSEDHKTLKFQESEVGTESSTVVMERPSFVKKQPGTKSEKISEGCKHEIRSASEVHNLETMMDSVQNVGREHVSSRSTVGTDTVNRGVTSQRPFIKKSATLPTYGESDDLTLERKDREVTPEIGTETAIVTIEKPTITKFKTTPGLNKQQSLDSAISQSSRSATTSVRISSLGSSVEEPSAVRIASLGSSLDEMGSCQIDVTLSATGDNRARTFVQTRQDSAIAGQVEISRQNSQSHSVSMEAVNQTPTRSVSMATTAFGQSESCQSMNGLISPQTDLSFSTSTLQSSQSGMLLSGATDQSNSILETSQSNLNDSFPQMMEEMDVNESCLGLATHQNLSNEIKEMMQESLKEQQSHHHSDRPHQYSHEGEQDRLPGTSHFRVGTAISSQNSGEVITLHVDPDLGSISLPSEDIQYLSEGPTIFATPNVVSKIDNTEESFQNEINDDLERNLLKKSSLPEHASLCERTDRGGHDAKPESQISEFEKPKTKAVHDTAQSQQIELPGPQVTPSSNLDRLHNLPVLTASDMPRTAVSKLCYQESLSSSSSSSLTSSLTHSQSSHSMMETSEGQGHLCPDLPPPIAEVIEICKPVIYKSRHVRSIEKKAAVTDVPKNSDSNISVKDAQKKFAEQDRSAKKVHLSSLASQGVTSERGEAKLVIEKIPGLQKKVQTVRAEKIPKPRRQIAELMDSDHGEFSGTEDEVFVDPNESSTSVPVRHFDVNVHLQKVKKQNSTDSMEVTVDTKSAVSNVGIEGQVSPRELLTRSSLDDSLMQMASSRHDNLLTMDSELENGEDIRFTKAHRSSKLLSLCEVFEKVTDGSQQAQGQGQSSSSVNVQEVPSQSAKRTSYESLETNRADHSDKFIQPVRVKKVNLSQSMGEKESQKMWTENPLFTSKRSMSVELSNLDHASMGVRVGLEQASGGDRLLERSVAGLGKPPKYRSNSKTRTASESSLSETEGIGKGSPKTSRLDTSPKSLRFGGSPKSARYSSSEDGSPKVTRGDVSPKVGLSRSSLSDDGSPQSVRHSVSVSPSVSPKGPRLNMGSFSDEGSPQTARHISSSRTGGSWGSLIRDSSPPMCQNRDVANIKMDISPRSHRTERISRGEIQRTERLSRGDSFEKYEKETSSSMQFEQTVQFSHEESTGRDGKKEVRRKSSIKELTNFFETQQEKQITSESPNRSPPQTKPRTRVRSASPGVMTERVGSFSESMLTTNVRHSLEFPLGGTLSHAEGIFKAPNLRLGPKPFYGAK